MDALARAFQPVGLGRARPSSVLRPPILPPLAFFRGQPSVLRPEPSALRPPSSAISPPPQPGILRPSPAARSRSQLYVTIRPPPKGTRTDHLAPHDVAVVRTRLGFSQAQFAQVLGISINTLQNWEQNRRKPTGPARVLLLMASKHPEMLLEVVA